jgi:tetratricopeptide (TPR) repeat protein
VADDRSIRVFVSSTFRDMQLERDELVKRVFPQVRHLCEQRGVTWSEVDLRWGVTDEQKSEGAVLPICLAEIERTRPYFIGLLGQRYGWVPDEIPATLAGEMGWLRDDAGRSVTELEILHGVLNDPEATEHAFFYLRDPAWVEQLPAEERGIFLEAEPDGERRLAALRERLTNSDFPTRMYPDPVALGELVLADLVALVESRFPDPRPPSPLQRAAGVHRSFGQRLRNGFVPRPAVAGRLQNLFDARRGPVLVTGQPGAGSSALVTEWVAGRAVTGEQVVVHHVEADNDAADHRALAARLVAVLDAGAGSNAAGDHDGHDHDGHDHDDDHDDEAVAAFADDPAALRSALRQAFARTAGRPVTIVLDGVDQLDDVDGAPDLRWLPDDIPSNVNIVATASGARPRLTFDHRGWTVLEVPPLDDGERRDIAVRFLARYAKGLDEVHLAALAGAANTSNPRFLRIVLDELRQHGDHFTLGERIGELCRAATIDDLLELVLARYERDFERDRPGLTRAAFTALWAARRGLAEGELLAIVGAGDEAPLPQAAWSPLHLAAEDGLVVRGGLLGIAHAELRKAIEHRYLATDDDRRSAHSVLAAYFARRPLSDRVVDELGWQQADAGDTEGLTRTLSDLDFAEHAYRRSPADMRRLWNRVDSRTAMVDAYRPVVDDPAAHDADVGAGTRRQLVWGVARLLADDGHPAEATPLFRYLVDRARVAPEGIADVPGGDAKLRAALVNLGAAHWSNGDLDAATPVLEEAVERCRASADPAMLSSALGDLAMVERDLGHHAAADRLFDEEAAICRQRDDEFGLQASLGNRAQLLRTMGRLDDALAALQEQENICRNLADSAAVARALAGRAAVLADRGDVAAAIALTEQYAATCRSEGDRRGLVEALLNLSVMHAQVGAADAALTAIGEAEGWARDLGQPDLLTRVLVARANALGQLGDWPQAEQVAREGELTARQAGLPAQACLALGVIGTARREQGDLPGGRSAHTAELELAESFGSRSAIATAQTNLGTMAIAEQRYDEMYQRYVVAEAILRELDVPSMLLPLLANRGQVNHATGRFVEALADLADAAQISARLGLTSAVTQWGDLAVPLAYQLGDTTRAEALWAVLAPAAEANGDDAALQRALGEWALMLINRAQPAGQAPTAQNVDQPLLAEAAGLLDRQEAVCRRSSNDVGLGACIGNRAIVRRYEGDLAGSLTCLDEQLAIATRIGDGQGALFATANRGEVLGLLGRTDEARRALHQARATAQAHGLTPMVQQLDMMIAGLAGNDS